MASEDVDLDTILEDLCSRFLINIPEEERGDVVRLCFQIETAHWFYIDFHRQERPELPSLGIKEFTTIIFQKFPFLNKTGENVNEIFESWRRYKFSVPVYGAIVLNGSLDKCLLVQPYMSRTSWGFPKGKVNKDEKEFNCAVREVLEETGFDITLYSSPDEFLESTIHDHQVRLYLASGVPEDTHFQPRTKGEIKSVQWFAVDFLPSHKKDTTSKEKLGLNPNAFFMVMPFVKDLRKWIANRLETGGGRAANNHLEKLLRREEKRLEEDKRRAELEKRRVEQQKLFLLQHELNHPLRHHHLTAHDKGFHGRRGSGERNPRILQRPSESTTRDKSFADSPYRVMSRKQGLPQSHTNSTSAQSGTPIAMETGVDKGRRISPEVLFKDPAPVLNIQLDVPETCNTWEDPEFLFSAPAFTKFRFDKSAIFACLPG